MNLVVGVEGDGARSLRALIIGMGVDCKEPAIHGEEYPTAWNQLGVGYVSLRSPEIEGTMKPLGLVLAGLALILAACGPGTDPIG